MKTKYQWQGIEVAEPRWQMNITGAKQAVMGYGFDNVLSAKLQKHYAQQQKDNQWFCAHKHTLYATKMYNLFKKPF
jgi:hypothetical protein